MAVAGGASLLATLARLGREDQVGLSEGALAFAALHGQTGTGEALAALAGAVDPSDGLEGLTGILSAFHLDEDEAAQLPEVVGRGAGSAAALALIWLEVARRAGWTAEALAFPGFVPVRLTADGGDRIIVDPGAGGRRMSAADLRAAVKAVEGGGAELRPALFAALSNRDILLRLQNEIKLRALLAGQVGEAVAVVEGMLAFAPDQVPLWREAGMMHLRLDHMPAAIAALEQFAARTANGAARRRTQQLLHDLRARLP